MTMSSSDAPTAEAEAGRILRAVLESDDSPGVRREAALALASFSIDTTEVVSVLVRALADPQDLVRRGAALALGGTRSPQALEPLLDALERYPELWQETSTALITLGEDAAAPRLREIIVSGATTRVRRAAVRALAGLVTARRFSAALEQLNGYEDEQGVMHPLL